MKRRIRIEITDRVKEHIASHNIKAKEVLSLFDQNYFVRREGNRYKFIGETDERRILALILEKKQDRFTLVTARDATKTEKALYKKKVK
jgi:uncharacterized DUF497 family protein